MSTGRPQREVAHRLFAVEFDDARVSVAESDEEMAPTYVLTPTGALVNRAFVVGVLTDVEQVGTEIYRGRVNDPTSTFVAYAGQYQPAAANFLADADPPGFVSLTGKARLFEPEGSTDVLSSIRPERLVSTTSVERDRWVAEAARHTLARIELMARARTSGTPAESIGSSLESDDVVPSLARGIELAVREYDTSATYLSAIRRRVIEALEVLEGERDAVTPLELDPASDDDSTTFDELASDRFVDVFRLPGAEALGAVEGAEPADAPVKVEPSTGDVADEGSATGPSAAVEEAVPPGEYELSEAERTAVEEEYGTEFTSGDDIDSPVEPSEDVPDPSADQVDADGASTSVATDEEMDLESTVLAHMRRLDEGDGVDRSTLVEAVTAATEADPAAIDDAIQDALMSGTCYEPQEDRLKPI